MDMETFQILSKGTIIQNQVIYHVKTTNKSSIFYEIDLELREIHC